jgi:muramoyltetrapeptide carboxypeptidase LdcA involved in peptidoglycan recycling
MLKGTPWWPAREAWDGAVVILEGSEEVPTSDDFCRTLRSWNAAGRLDRIAALLVGRARDYDGEEKLELEETLRDFMIEEAGRPDVVVLANCDFGHTDPQWILPLGCEVEVDAERARVTLLEAAVS